MEDTRGAYRVLVVKHEGMKPLGRPIHRWEDNINIDIKKWDWVGTGLIWLREGAGVVGSCNRGSDLNVSTKCGKFLEMQKTC
jgi:hypothetical protein